VSTPEITTVIVSWNSGAALPSSLGALRRSADAADAAIEVIVIDNGSADDSALVARNAGADLVVENPLNAGYVAAASQGIALANGPWVMLANPDLTVSEGFVGAMLRAAGAVAADVACLIPDIRYSADPNVVNSRGIEVDVVGVPAEKDAGLEARTLPGLVEVFGASSSGCLLRRDALAAVGGLEPMYFAYLEDVDVSWRLRKKGYRALVVPDAIALHEGSASTGEGSWLKAFLVARNRRALFRLHGPRGPAVRGLRAVTEIGHATVQALSGSGSASVRGRIAALGTRRYTRFLRASNKLTGMPDDAHVELARRQSLQEALRRKRAAAALMHRDEAAGAGARRRPRRPTVAPTRERLRVLVDATNLKPGQGGIRTYTIGLIQALAAQEELTLVVAASVDDIADLGPMELVHISPRTQSVVARAVWRERHLASLARSSRADIVLTPVPELPLRRLPVPSVIVVHDVGPLVAPAFYSFAKKRRYEAVLPRTCQLASAVVCVSHTTLMGLYAATGIDPSRCQVIGEGPQLLATGGDPTLQRAPYLLYVGDLEARKNVKTLLAAVLGSDPPLAENLVIVGPAEGRVPPELKAQLAKVDGDSRVQHLGFVSPERLTSLYREASALVLPSLYEGFGLTVLEAMTCGTPVVASDIGSVREVAGDAALYVSRPLDPDCWREALERISTDASLRAELSRRGAETAAKSSWSQVGQQFSELLHSVARSGARVVTLTPGNSPEATSRAAPSPQTGMLAGAEPSE